MLLLLLLLMTAPEFKAVDVDNAIDEGAAEGEAAVRFTTRALLLWMLLLLLSLFLLLLLPLLVLLLLLLLSLLLVDRCKDWASIRLLTAPPSINNGTP